MEHNEGRTVDDLNGITLDVIRREDAMISVALAQIAAAGWPPARTGTGLHLAQDRRFIQLDGIDVYETVLVREGRPVHTIHIHGHWIPSPFAEIERDGRLIAVRPPIALEKRIYHDGAHVEVWREERQKWVRGEVFGYEHREGAWRYLVQLSGFPAMQANDPSSWFTAAELRPVG